MIHFCICLVDYDLPDFFLPIPGLDLEEGVGVFFSVFAEKSLRRFAELLIAIVDSAKQIHVEDAHFVCAFYIS